MIVNKTCSKFEIKGIIFDLDGTLINSEDNYYISEKKLLSRYGINLTNEVKREYVGIGDREFVNRIKKRFHINESVEYLLDEKKKMYLELAKENTYVFPVMEELLRALKSNNYNMSIATGSTRDILNTIMKVINIKDYFSNIVSSEEVSRGKPFPDVFLETAKRMNTDPKNILVFEDSKSGVEAAIRANMQCIAIPEPQEKLNDVFYETEILFEEGIKSFDFEFVVNWIKNEIKKQ